MHLGRWLFALEAGHVAKRDVAAELARIVIVTKLALVPEGDLPHGPGKGPGATGFSHVCPVKGCSSLISGYRLMCAQDWSALGRSLRAEVWRTWQSGTGARSPEHRLAADLAVSAAEAVRA